MLLLWYVFHRVFTVKPTPDNHTKNIYTTDAKHQLQALKITWQVYGKCEVEEAVRELIFVWGGVG